MGGVQGGGDPPSSYSSYSSYFSCTSFQHYPPETSSQNASLHPFDPCKEHHLHLVCRTCRVHTTVPHFRVSVYCSCSCAGFLRWTARTCMGGGGGHRISDSLRGGGGVLGTGGGGIASQIRYMGEGVSWAHGGGRGKGSETGEGGKSPTRAATRAGGRGGRGWRAGRGGGWGTADPGGTGRPSRSTESRGGGCGRARVFLPTAHAPLGRAGGGGGAAEGRRTRSTHALSARTQNGHAQGSLQEGKAEG